MSFVRRLRLEEVEFSVEFVTRGVKSPIRVVARWGGFSSWVATHDVCHSLEAFELEGPYEEMCFDALASLQDEIDEIADRLGPLITKELFDEWMMAQVHDA